MTKFNNENTTIAAYRVFETLKFIIKQPAGVSDIQKYLESLNINEGKVYSKGVIYKYITTIKFAGIDVARNKCKYEVKNLPFKLPFSDEDYKTIILLEDIISQICEKNLTKSVKKLIYTLKMRSSISESKISELKKEYKPIKLDVPTEKQIKIIEKYEKFCNDKLKLSIDYQNIYGEKCKLKAEPIEVKFENNQIYLYLYCELTNDFIELNSNQIIKIIQMPTKCSTTQKQKLAHTTIFKLSDKLAKRYKPRNNEIITQADENIIITNKTEAKNKLLPRLLRYGTFCEVQSPKMERNKIKEMIAKTLSNYNISV
ncbi:WYL domain-containing protein [bacterium]|nr:WYL domain-containing protein [bacterium]